MLKVISRDGAIAVVQTHCDNCNSGWTSWQILITDWDKPCGLDRYGNSFIYPGSPDLCRECVRKRLDERMREALREFEEGVNTE